MNKIALVTACFFAAAANAHATDASVNWAKNCAACHGKDGKGITRAGRMAGVKDMTDAAYQKSFTDKQAFAQIKNGFKNDKGKQKMKAFGEKLDDNEIKALVAYVRSLSK